LMRQQDFYDKTIHLSVHEFWPNYNTYRANEITVQTQKLANFLNA